MGENLVWSSTRTYTQAFAFQHISTKLFLIMEETNFGSYAVENRSPKHSQKNSFLFPCWKYFFL